MIEIVMLNLRMAGLDVKQSSSNDNNWDEYQGSLQEEVVYTAENLPDVQEQINLTRLLTEKRADMEISSASVN